MADANTRAAFSDVVSQYLNRRLPWGTPWWPYAVALGVANVIRQLVKPDDLSTAADATIFVLIVVVMAAVLFVAVTWIYRRRSSTTEQYRPRIGRRAPQASRFAGSSWRRSRSERTLGGE